jgi:hypothetical protein
MNTDHVQARPRIRIRKIGDAAAPRLIAEESVEGAQKRKANGTSWKPGKSGNPKGRPKGAKGVKAITRKVLTEKVEVQPGKKMQVFEALLRQEAQSASKGDWRARATMFNLARWFLGPDVDAEAVLASEPDMTPTSRAILEMFVDEVRGGDDGRDASRAKQS